MSIKPEVTAVLDEPIADDEKGAVRPPDLHRGDLASVQAWIDMIRDSARDCCDPED